MIGLFFLLQLNLYAMSPEGIKCAKNQSLVDYRDPFNQNRILFCQENIDGQLVQKGPKFEFSPDGKLISGAFVDTVLQKKTSHDIEREVSSIENLFSVFMPLSRNRYSSDFKYSGCRISKNMMLGLVMFNKPFSHTYAFSETCDLEGTIHVKLGEAFPVSLKLRHLKGFEKVNFSLLISFVKESVGVKIEYLATQGLLYSTDKEVGFSAKYYYLLNLNKKSNQGQENMGGEIHVQRINEDNVDIKKNILFD